MLFSSIPFLVFFLPATLLFYYMLPAQTWRNSVLLCASLLFYAWGEPKFVLLMLASIVFNYNAGLWLGAGTGNRRLLLAGAVLANVAVLFVFKYLGFSCKIINEFLRALHCAPLSAVNLVMPIGISFYTFQEISYLVDVYCDPTRAQKSVPNLGLYIAFFPQLIAGPIVRYGDIAAQIDSRSVSAESFAAGLERFIVGLGKKVLLANSFALVCDSIYGADFFSYGAYPAWIAAVAYTFQIYYDFSGYSDMAIGLAKLFGFDLPENFDYPYSARSVTEFWRRWHITLTSFFRDYVYIPLGGNRKGAARTVLNRFAVFFTTGLWHGAAFNFVLWGLLHGALMTAERLGGKTTGQKNAPARNRPAALRVLWSVVRRAYTLLSVMFLWVLFRNGTKRSAKLLLKMFGVNYTRFTAHFHAVAADPMLGLYIDTRFFILAALGIVFAFPWWRALQFPKAGAGRRVLYAAKCAVLLGLFVLCYARLADNSYNPFIYFRF